VIRRARLAVARVFATSARKVRGRSVTTIELSCDCGSIRGDGRSADQPNGHFRPFSVIGTVELFSPKPPISMRTRPHVGPVVC